MKVNRSIKEVQESKRFLERAASVIEEYGSITRIKRKNWFEQRNCKGTEEIKSQ
jgi:hypothetical protein